MRISDWSSDVCSSDLVLVLKSKREMLLLREGKAFRTYRVALGIKPRGDKMQRGDNRTPEGEYVLGGRHAGSRFRSEERRVGKEDVSPCISRWSADRSKKKQ